MCTDCGCSITGSVTAHTHEHTHDGKTHSHSHDHTEEGHHHSHDHSHDHQKAHEHLNHNPQLNDAKTISVIQKILDKNDHEAEHNRAHLNAKGILGINLMSSPGSGKTTLLEHLSDVAEFRFGVVEGDLETSKDADRLKAKGIPAMQIQTGSACHLDAFMVHKGLHEMPLDELDVCFVENVGNLVCPASYDVGTHLNIVLVSIPEGEDKIAKYPVMFRQADLVLITKIDLLPHFKYDIEAEKAEARRIKPNVDILEVNVNDMDSVKAVADWIEFKRKMRG
jgi:hydrogenase nickel incorporation protein HypB